MEKIAYHNVIDKSDWADGPWKTEPDKVQWEDRDTGLPCLIVRTKHHGALCGYVGVPPGHPWHGKDYDEVLWDHPDPENKWDLCPDVHGGLTFADGCSHGGDQSRGICHIPAPGEPDDIWWLGFDCAHYSDATPGMDAAMERRGSDYRSEGTYRDITYVHEQVTALAKQAANPLGGWKP